jgi:hypothetical protein
LPHDATVTASTGTATRAAALERQLCIFRLLLEG